MVKFKVRRKNANETYTVYQILYEHVVLFVLYDAVSQKWKIEIADNFIPLEGITW